MSAEEKIMESVKEDVSSQDTPQAITIHIMAPSNLETTSIDSALVASVEAQDARSEGESNSLLVVPSDGDDAISVSSKNILQTVTETHISEDLTVISNISSDHGNEQTIELGVKSAKKAVVEVIEEDIGCHCLICNEELEDDSMSVFKSFTTTSQRKISIFLGIVVGQKLSSRKVHSTIICDKCFQLLNKLDLLEVEIKTTKEEIVNKYQQTVTQYGGRARRKKPAAAKKSEYVFPKLEPDEDKDLEAEEDDIYEPKLEDLIEEEHDQREDRESVDEEWEPDVKRAKVKRELSNPDPAGPPKRKRGRPRKDAAKPKGQLRYSHSLQESKPASIRLAIRKERKRLQESSRDESPMSNNKTQDGINCSRTGDVSCVGSAIPSDFHLDFENLKCTCGVEASSKNEYVQHIMLMHRCQIFKCPGCSCAFSSSPHLVRHQRLIHSGNGRKSPDQEHTKTKEESSLSIGGTQCCFCSEVVVSEMTDHLKNHIFGMEECPVCACGFKTSQSLQCHIKMCHPEIYKTFLKIDTPSKEKERRDKERVHFLEFCDVCGKAATSFARLMQHRYSQHPEHYPWSCSDCNLSFPSKNDQENHICHKSSSRCKTNNIKNDTIQEKGALSENSAVVKYSGKRSRMFKNSGDLIKCPVCVLVFPSRKAFRDHVRSHKRNGFKCSHCEAKLKTMANLRAHVSTQHTHAEIHSCNMCSKVFLSAGKLSCHMKIHHTDRHKYNNLCHICGKSYQYPSELKLHLRFHWNYRPYECDHCCKTFIKKGDLTYHIRSHTGERPHKCPRCDAQFPRPNTLLNHIRHKHQENPTEGINTSSTSTNTTTVKTKTVSVGTATPNTKPPSGEGLSSVAVMVEQSSLPCRNNDKEVESPKEKEGHDIQISEKFDNTEESHAQNEKTPMPIIGSQLVEGEVTEMQPVHYVVERVEYDETTERPFQIIHFQIIQ